MGEESWSSSNNLQREPVKEPRKINGLSHPLWGPSFQHHTTLPFQVGLNEPHTPPLGAVFYTPARLHTNV